MVLTNLSILSSNKVCFITDRYVPGDVLMIKPQNVMEAVDEFVQVLKLDPDTLFVLKQNDPGLLQEHIKYYDPGLLGMFPNRYPPALVSSLSLFNTIPPDTLLGHTIGASPVIL